MIMLTDSEKSTFKALRDRRWAADAGLELMSRMHAAELADINHELRLMWTRLAKKYGIDVIAGGYAIQPIAPHGNEYEIVTIPVPSGNQGEIEVSPDLSTTSG